MYAIRSYYALEKAGIQSKSAALDKGQILVRFNNTEDQLRARDLVGEALGEQFIAALNLAPATPAWLSSIGAGPLKLGLDLRGSYNFV